MQEAMFAAIDMYNKNYDNYLYGLASCNDAARGCLLQDVALILCGYPATKKKDARKALLSGKFTAQEMAFLWLFMGD